MSKRNFGFSAPIAAPTTNAGIVSFLLACALAGSILAIVYRVFA